MSPAQIRDRLDQRFQPLTGGARGAQARTRPCATPFSVRTTCCPKRTAIT